MTLPRKALGPLAARPVFLHRLRRMGAIAIGLVAFTLIMGSVGYRMLIPGLSWIDAFHQSSMLMSGMGPVFPPDLQLSTTAKLFDSVYALFCGVVLLASTGLLFAPIFHRLLHRFRLEDAPRNE